MIQIMKFCDSNHKSRGCILDYMIQVMCPPDSYKKNLKMAMIKIMHNPTLIKPAKTQKKYVCKCGLAHNLPTSFLSSFQVWGRKKIKMKYELLPLKPYIVHMRKIHNYPSLIQVKLNKSPCQFIMIIDWIFLLIMT